MIIINISDYISLMLLVIFTGLMVYLGRETKKSIIPGTMLIAYLILLVVYATELVINKGEDLEIAKILNNCILVNLVLVFISFFGYLWADDIEAKAKNKKSVSNDLDWLWRNI